MENRGDQHQNQMLFFFFFFTCNNPHFLSKNRRNCQNLSWWAGRPSCRKQNKYNHCYKRAAYERYNLATLVGFFIVCLWGNICKAWRFWTFIVYIMFALALLHVPVLHSVKSAGMRVVPYVCSTLTQLRDPHIQTLLLLRNIPAWIKYIYAHVICDFFDHEQFVWKLHTWRVKLCVRG